jgi:agmatine deiminase
MIADHETNLIYVSSLLKRRFPAIFAGLRQLTAEHGIGFGCLARTRDIWCRDFMPIQLDGDGTFQQFQYRPDYLENGYSYLATDARAILRSLRGVRSCRRSEIVVDGGNVVRSRTTAIVADKVFQENPGFGPQDLLTALRRALGAERVILIPTEKGDIFGHADGVVRFIDATTVLVNDYLRIDPRYRAELMRVFRRERLDVVELPYEPSEGVNDGIPSACGNYINFLQVSGLIVMPTYGLPHDEQAAEVLRHVFPGVTMRQLPCAELAEEGGVLNCVTWSIRA